MGIHLLSKSWRAPLQLIDSWLPAPAPRGMKKAVAAPLMRRFVRAGWLGKAGEASSCEALSAPVSKEKAALPGRATSSVRRAGPARTARDGGRLVISGRLADVCAELDRLAALEHPSGAH